MQRYNNVDLLRFIFAVFIIIFHCHGMPFFRPILDSCPGIIRGNICVDYFFIIGGFFLFYLINKNFPTLEFVKKKFFRLAPLMWLSVGIIFILNLLCNEIKFELVPNILRCFLLTNIGFTGKNGLVSAIPWFVSVYFWVSIFYFYIYKIFDKKYLNLIICLIVFIGSTMYYSCCFNATAGNTRVVLGFIDIGLLRGLIGMGIGYLISEIYKKKMLFNLSLFGKTLCTFIEFGTLYFIFYYMTVSNKIPTQSAFVFKFMFAILLYLLLIKQGYIAKLLNNKWLGFPGKYSYAMYMIHWVVIKYFYYIAYPHHRHYYNHHPWVVILYIVLITIGISIVVHHLYEKPVGKYLSGKFPFNNEKRGET